MKTKILLAAIFAFCLTNCAPYRNAITQPAVSQIRPGVTTKADLVQLFGRPDTQVTAFNGDTTLDWFRSVGPNAAGYAPVVGQFLGGLDLEVQQLIVVVGRSGRVRSFTVYDSNGPLKSEKTKLRTTRETGYHK